MESSQIVMILALITLGAVVAFALYSKRNVEKLKQDPNAPKSSLAKDSKDGPPDVVTAKPIPPMR